MRLLGRCILVLVGLVLAGEARGQWTWEPVRDADRQLAASAVDPKAGAEAIFVRIRIEDMFTESNIKSVLDEYVRIKIFSAADAQRLTQVRIPHGTRGVRVTDVAARTILPDGTTLDVAAKDMKDISLARAEGREARALSFAMPRLQPGAIYEYRWRVTTQDALADGITLDVQMGVPIQKAEIDIKPLELSNWRLQIMPFSLSANVPADRVLGWYKCTAENVRALPDEPYAPPGRRQRGFLFAYYLGTDVTSADEYWGRMSDRIAKDVEEEAERSSDIAPLAREIVGDASTDSLKLQRLVRWCRRELRPLTDAAFASRARRRDIPIGEIVESRTASDLDAANALAALARAAGMRARLVLLESRAGMPFRKSVLNLASLRVPTVIVDTKDGRFHCTARARGVAWDDLPWDAEGMRGIVCTRDSLVTMTAQVAAPSALERITDATVLPNGDVEGTVKFLLARHWAEDWWDRVHEAADRERVLRAFQHLEKDRATFSDIAVQSAGADSDTVVVTARFRWPGYATTTEKRVLVQPALWSARASAVFPSESRQTPVQFPFCWVESDSVTLHAPAGFRLEGGDRVEPFEADPLVWHALGVTTESQGVVTFRRLLRCGTAEHTMFPRSSYSDVRAAFQSVASRDQYTLTLTRAAP